MSFRRSSLVSLNSDDDFEEASTVKRDNSELLSKQPFFRKSFKSLPTDFKKSLPFCASETFFYNKWIQSDFLSMLLVHGCKGDSEETIMVKAYIVTSPKLATEMQLLKSRASTVLAQSIRSFLLNRRERRERDNERISARKASPGKMCRYQTSAKSLRFSPRKQETRCGE